MDGGANGVPLAHGGSWMEGSYASCPVQIHRIPYLGSRGVLQANVENRIHEMDFSKSILDGKTSLVAGKE